MADINLNITDEYIDEMIERVIEERVNSVIRDHWDLRDYLNSRFTEALGGKIDEAVEKLADETLKEELDKPFCIRDSYGCKKESHDTYAEFMRGRIRDRFTSDWDLRNKMKKAIEEKVDQTWKECKDRAVATLLAEFAEKEGEA